MPIVLTTPQLNDPLLKTIAMYFKINVYADTMKGFSSSTASLHLIEITILLVNRHYFPNKDNQNSVFLIKI